MQVVQLYYTKKKQDLMMVQMYHTKKQKQDNLQ